MECSNCGKNMPDNNRFCSECGQQLTMPKVSSVPEIVPCQPTLDTVIVENINANRKTTAKYFRPVANKIHEIAKVIGRYLYKNVRITSNDVGLVLISLGALLVMANIALYADVDGIVIGAILVVGCVLASFSRTVYVVDDRFFHLNHKCNGMEGAKKMSAKKARQSGLLPCENCTGFSFKTMVFSVLKFFCIVFIVSLIITSIYNKQYDGATLLISLILAFVSLIIIAMVYDSLKNGYEKVWVQSGNMKYHKNKDCSNMKASRKTGVMKAKSLGYVPCSKCCKPKKTIKEDN